tara:strand:- start:2136 stop:2579 length:444 start_codon:yes stop_codon:yes gene_type:complete
MEQENKLILINKNINEKFLNEKKKNSKARILDFSDYKLIEKVLRNNKNRQLEIYDVTQTNDQKELTPINDHINRIGHNPFIGKQKEYEIDFINIERLYTQHKKGVVTNSCGDQKQILPHPSTHIANIATLAYILNYKIEAYLVHTEK